MNAYPAPNDLCSECGTEIEPHFGDVRCPACFDKHLFSVDAGFLESYRRFGSRSRLIVAESCLRSLVVESPDHRKVLAMTIFEQYVQAMNDLVGLFAAYVTGVALGPGASYRSVFRIAGTVAFAGYGLALAQSSIWYGRSWTTTLKSIFDALI